MKRAALDTFATFQAGLSRRAETSRRRREWSRDSPARSGNTETAQQEIGDSPSLVERQKTRQQEMEAVSKALAVLSGDDAHDLFSKVTVFKAVGG